MNISTISNCSGCMACIDKCPKQCITVTKGKLGHLFPLVTENQCVDCGLCLKTCPANNHSHFLQPLSVWATWRKDENKRIESSSGGLASVLSEVIIKTNGHWHYRNIWSEKADM